jgi:hypothetical protein
MAEEPHSTLRVTTDESRCTVVFEPWGSEYELSKDDEIHIHLYEGAARPEDADVEVVQCSGMILLWPPDKFRAWNKAGRELQV